MKRVSLLFMPLCFILIGCEPEPGIVEPELAAILDEYRGENDRFGVLFAKYDGDTSWVYTAGEIEAGDNLRLASVSKIFLSFMFLREGLDLDGTIDAFYPSDQYPGAEKITARMLLNHTSGIPDEIEVTLRQLGDDPDPQEEFRHIAKVLSQEAEHPDRRIENVYNHDLGLDFRPGTRWCYSNTGYILLGRMLERSTGTPVKDLIEKHYGDRAPSLYLDDGRDAVFPASMLQPLPYHWSQPWVAGGFIATATNALKTLHHISLQPEFQKMQEWSAQPRCKREVVAGTDYGLGLQRYIFNGMGEGLGHDGMAVSRSLLFALGDEIYLLYITRFVSNSEMMTIAHRLLEAQL
jgi:hypothetical protein